MQVKKYGKRIFRPILSIFKLRSNRYMCLNMSRGFNKDLNKQGLLN